MQLCKCSSLVWRGRFGFGYILGPVLLAKPSSSKIFEPGTRQTQRLLPRRNFQSTFTDPEIASRFLTHLETVYCSCRSPVKALCEDMIRRYRQLRCRRTLSDIDKPTRTRLMSHDQIPMAIIWSSSPNLGLPTILPQTLAHGRGTGNLLQIWLVAGNVFSIFEFLH